MTDHDDLYKEYAELTQQEKAIKERKLVIEKAVLLEVGSVKGGIETEWGTFQHRSYRRWIYSEDYKEKEAMLKDALKKEQERDKLDGKAKMTETYGLVFIAKKGE